MSYRTTSRLVKDQELVFRYEEFLEFVRSRGFIVPLEKHFEIEVFRDQDTSPKRITFLRDEVLVIRMSEVRAV